VKCSRIERFCHLMIHGLDMPPGKFIYASEAWLMCRKSLEDPDKFGIFDMHGLWFVRGNLLRELAALNDAEMLPWDVWGLMKLKDEDMTQEDYALLDRVACLLARGSDEIHALYEREPRLRVPREMIVSG